MAQALKTYFSHFPNWIHAFLLGCGIYYIWRSGAFSNYWYMTLLLIALIPFIEFFIHKYILHMPRPQEPEKHKIWDYVTLKMHYLHHQNPKIVGHIFAHWWMTLPPLALIFGLFYLLSQNLQLTAVFVSSLIAYYLFYEWCHFISHFDGYTPHSRYGRFMKKFHLWHHYKNEDYWYGITNPVADWIFRTWKDPKSTPASEMALRNRGRI